MDERPHPGDLPPLAWNDTARASPALTLSEAFAAQVDRTPRATALRFRDEALTYDELDGWASAFAMELVGLGAGPDALVAVSMERSLEMVVALYAIHKAGAA